LREQASRLRVTALGNGRLGVKLFVGILLAGALV